MFFRKKDEPKPPAKPAAAAPTPGPSPASPEQPATPVAPATAANMPLPPSRELFTTYGAEPKGAAATRGTDGHASADSEHKDPLRAFAHIVTLLMKTPETKGLSLVDLEWLVIPALRRKQMVVAETRAKEGSQPAPVGMLLWARVSPEVDARLTRDLNALPKIEPAEWGSGDIAWVIATIGRQNVVNAMLGELMRGPLAGKSIKVRGVADGKLTVREVRLNQAA